MLAAASERGRLAGEVHVVLDRNRHAEQGRALPRGQAPVGLRSGRACLLGEDQAKRVKQRLERLRALERGLYERGGGDLTGRDELGLPLEAGELSVPLAEPLDLDATAAGGGKRDSAAGDLLRARRGGGEAGAPEDGGEHDLHLVQREAAPMQRRMPPPNGSHS